MVDDDDEEDADDRDDSKSEGDDDAPIEVDAKLLRKKRKHHQCGVNVRYLTLATDLKIFRIIIPMD